MRDALGIDGPTELEVTERDGALELTVPYTRAWLEEHDGLVVIATEQPLPPLGQEKVREVLESVRK